jgi:hypothetical protein
MLAILAALALGVGVASTPDLVAAERDYVDNLKSEAVVEVQAIQVVGTTSIDR